MTQDRVAREFLHFQYFLSIHKCFSCNLSNTHLEEQKNTVPVQIAGFWMNDGLVFFLEGQGCGGAKKPTGRSVFCFLCSYYLGWWNTIETPLGWFNITIIRHVFVVGSFVLNYCSFFHGLERYLTSNWLSRKESNVGFPNSSLRWWNSTLKLNHVFPIGGIYNSYKIFQGVQKTTFFLENKESNDPSRCPKNLVNGS